MHWPKSRKMPFLSLLFVVVVAVILGRICVAPNNILINHTNRLKWATHYYSDTHTYTPTNYEEEQIIKKAHLEHGDSLEKPISNHPSHSYKDAHTHASTHSLHEMIDIILFYICIFFYFFLFGFDINGMWKHQNWFVCECVYVSFTIQSAAFYLHGNLSISFSSEMTVRFF